MDRFDLEESIMSCWSTKEDIQIICESLLDGDCDMEKIANALMGVAELHDMKCKKAFDIFEKVVVESDSRLIAITEGESRGNIKKAGSRPMPKSPPPALRKK
jgi:hypothetical protein